MRTWVRGVQYFVRVDGEPFPEGDLPLLLLHGFTGSTDTWAPHISAFSARRPTIAVDLLGHGQSDAPDDPDRYRAEACVKDLIELLDRCQFGRVHVLGYSMGGRVALHLAAAHPDRVGRLILESASPGIERADDRSARKQRDAELADSIEREGIERFVDRWERLPLFASQTRLSNEVRGALRRQRLQNRPRGLANSLRGLGTGAQPPLHHRLGDISVPTLLIAGALDDKFAEIARLMENALPFGRAAVVEGAGHAVHFERPDEFERLVLTTLGAARSEGRGT